MGLISDYYFYSYLIFINFVGGILFAYDKITATAHRRRIPESTLHLLEFAGSVFSILVLMYLVKHKNRKFAYRIWTWLFLSGWIMIIFLSLSGASF